MVCAKAPPPLPQVIKHFNRERTIKLRNHIFTKDARNQLRYNESFSSHLSSEPEVFDSATGIIKEQVNISRRRQIQPPVLSPRVL